MKLETYFEMGDQQLDVKSFEEQAKEAWKSAGKRVKDINKLALYIKPEEKACYYVFNEQETGKIPF